MERELDVPKTLIEAQIKLQEAEQRLKNFKIVHINYKALSCCILSLLAVLTTMWSGFYFIRVDPVTIWWGCPLLATHVVIGAIFIFLTIISLNNSLLFETEE